MRVTILLMIILLCTFVLATGDNNTVSDKMNQNFEQIALTEETILAPGQFVSWYVNSVENKIEPAVASPIPLLNSKIKDVVPADWQLGLRRNLDELSKIELNAAILKETPYWLVFSDINIDGYADMFVSTREGHVLCYLGPDFYATDEIFKELQLANNPKIGFADVNSDKKQDLLVLCEGSALSAQLAPDFKQQATPEMLENIKVEEYFKANESEEILKTLNLKDVNCCAYVDVNQDMLKDFVYVTDTGVFYRENIANGDIPKYFSYDKKVTPKINVTTEYAAAPFLWKVSDTEYRLYVGNLAGEIDVFTGIPDAETKELTTFTKTKTIKKDDIDCSTIPFVLDLNGDKSVESVIVNTAGDLRIYDNADFEKEIVIFDFEKDAYPDFFDYNDDSKPDIMYFDSKKQLVWRKNTSENAGKISFDEPEKIEMQKNLIEALKDLKYSALTCAMLNSDDTVDFAIGLADGRVKFFVSPDYNETNDVIYELDAGEYAVPRFCIFEDEEGVTFFVGNAEGEVKFFFSTFNPYFLKEELENLREPKFHDSLESEKTKKTKNIMKYFIEEYMGWSKEFEKPEDKEAFFDSIGNDDKALLVRSMGKVSEAYEKMILDAPKHLRDEIIFAVANTPAPVLRTMFELNQHDILLENAKGIYEVAKQVSYAKIVELDDGRTTVEYLRENRTWQQIPADIYYWWVVHPRLLFEIPARINCEYWHKSMEEHGVDELTWLRKEQDIYANPEKGDFWRSLFPTNNFHKRRLIDYAKRAETFEQAMKRAHEYVSWSFADSFMHFGYKTQDLQAIQIYYKGYGSCGEQSIIAAAVGRSMLIPTAIVTNHGEDHQWNEIYSFGDWIHWDINHLDMDAPWNSTEKFNHRSNIGAVNNWWGNDYSVPTTTRVNNPKTAGYTKTGKGYTDVARIHVTVEDSAGKPVEGALVYAKSHWNDANQTSVRRITGKDGKALLELGKGSKNGYTIATISSAGAAGIQYYTIEENKNYNLTLRVPGFVKNRQNRVSSTRMSKNDYKIDFELTELKSLLFPPNPTTSRPFRINSETIKQTNYQGTRDFPYPVNNDDNLKLYLFTPVEYMKFTSGHAADAFRIITLNEPSKFEDIRVPKECFAVLMNTESLFIYKRLKAKLSLEIPGQAPEIEFDGQYSEDILLGANETFEITGAISDNSNQVYLEGSINGGINWIDCSKSINAELDTFTLKFPDNLNAPVVSGKYSLLIRARDASGRMKYAQPVNFVFKGTKHYLNQVFVQDDPETPLPKSSWMFGPFRIDEGTRFLAIKTESSSEGFDLDLFLFFDKNGNLKLDGMHEERTKSTSPTPNEKIFIANPAPGTYWIYAQGWKVEGEQAFADIHVSFDYKPRLLKNITPLGNHKSVDTVSAEFVHIAGILSDKVKVYIDDADVTADCAISRDGFTLNLPAELKKDVQHNVRVVLEDFSGNTDDVSWSFKVDDTQPVILEAKIDAELADTGFITLTALINEEAELQYAIDDKPFASFKDKKTEFADNVDVFDLAGGEHKITLKAVDSAGNFSLKTLNFSMPDIKIAIRFMGKISENIEIGTPNQTLKFKVKSTGKIIKESLVIMLDGQKFAGVATIIEDILYLMPFDEYKHGLSKIEIYLADDAGNKLSPFEFSFTRKIN
ncbi:MAG: hypothetical protein K8S87_02935, partial [Planctomycetes bacterium]|nr:hypothetical protein [Planctomycetota bacterium]